MECSYTPFPPFSAGLTQWPQRIADPFVTTPFPFVPLSGQPSEPLQDYNRGTNEYDHNDQIATPAPTITPRLFNSMHGNDHDLVSNMNGMELAHMQLESWPNETPTSTFLNYTQQNQNPYQYGYAPESSVSRLHGQHPSTDLAAGDSLGLAVPQQATNRWDSSQEDSASQGESNRI